MYYCYCVYRDARTQIAELLEIIGANEHSELVIREHTLKVNRWLNWYFYLSRTIQLIMYIAQVIHLTMHVVS